MANNSLDALGVPPVARNTVPLPGNTGIVPPTMSGMFGTAPPINTGGNLPSVTNPTGTNPIAPAAVSSVAPLPQSGVYSTPGSVPPSMPTQGTGGTTTVPTSPQVPTGSTTQSQSQSQSGVPTGFSPTDIMQQIAAALTPVSGPSGIATQDPNQIVQNSLSSFEDAGSRYMTDAARRGLEVAGSRGLLNSTIASGSAQRAALESVAPFVQQAVDISNMREGQSFNNAQNALARQQQSNMQQFDLAGNLIMSREQQAFQGEQSALDRQLKTDLQNDAAMQQDWLSSRDFQRQFNAQLSMMPINNAYDMSAMIAQYAIQNPEVYTPEVISGMTNFFQNNMMSILAQYFPDLVNVTGGQ